MMITCTAFAYSYCFSGLEFISGLPTHTVLVVLNLYQAPSSIVQGITGICFSLCSHWL